jgi:hypothetical protein
VLFVGLAAFPSSILVSCGESSLLVSDDTVCGLYRAHKDKEHEFLD